MHIYKVDALTFYSTMFEGEGRIEESYTMLAQTKDMVEMSCVVVRWVSLTNGNQVCGRQYFFVDGTYEMLVVE